MSDSEYSGTMCMYVHMYVLILFCTVLHSVAAQYMYDIILHISFCSGIGCTC